MPKFKVAAGKANFGCQVLLTTAAVCCSLAAMGSCAFANRSTALSAGSNRTAICDNIAPNECASYISNHAVGYFAWQVIVPVDEKICMDYTQPTYSGYVTLPVDAKFNTGKASLIIANVFGLVAFFTLILASCCPLDAGKMAGLSCSYFLATFFQGLSFLIYPSIACQEGFFEPFFNPNSGLSDNIDSVSCSLGLGAKLSVAATVLYFVCMCTVPMATPPSPIGGIPDDEPAAGGGDDGGDGEQE